MDNKITKQRINNHLEYDWFLYVLILIAGIVGTYFLFSQINKTRDYEDVALFISCYADRTNDFSGRTLGDMSSSRYQTEWKQRYGDAVLRKVSVEVRDPLDNDYNTLLQTHGTIMSDIIMLDKQYLKNAGNAFLVLSDELLNDYLLPERAVRDPQTGNVLRYEKTSIDDFEYFEQEMPDGSKRRLGVKVSGYTGVAGVFETDWRKVADYNEKYASLKEEEQPADEFYLCLNSQSVSVGKFGKKAKDKNAQALFVFNRFLSYYAH